MISGDIELALRQSVENPMLMEVSVLGRYARSV